MLQQIHDSFVENFVETGKSSPPRHLGRRYDAAGNFLRERGNTIICRVVEASASAATIAGVREGLKALPFAERFAFTPVSSLHMTVFQGIVESRRCLEYWPAGMPLDMAVDDTTRLFVDRLAGFPPVRPFRMRVTSVTPLGLTLAGAAPDDERIVRWLRDEMAALLGYSHPDHFSYGFHITLAYIKRWLPAGAEEAYLPRLAELRRQFGETDDVVELDPPALCTFEDMTEFRQVVVLG